MRHVKWIFVVLLVCSLTSFVDKGKATGGLSVGCVAPDFTFKATPADTKSVNLYDLRGQYVLLSFWASYDAQSRADNVLLHNVLKAQNPDVQMVSISFDDYRPIFEETIRKDQIHASVCYVDTEGEESDLYQDYRLNHGFSNFLLDADGVIIAKNISATELSDYLAAL